MNYRRILKSGALAVITTAAFALFAYRMAEWSKGIDSQMAVTGPDGTRIESCSSSAADSASAPITSIIPQLVLGTFDGGLTKYSTTIQIVNTTGTPQRMSASFFKEDGTALNNVTLTAGTYKISNGVLPATAVPKESVLVISEGEPQAKGLLGWAKVMTCPGLGLWTFFEWRDAASNMLHSRVSVPTSAPNMSSFIIPRVREVKSGLDVGFALVNTATEGTSTLKAELKDAAGKTIASTDISMPGGSHRALFTKELFLSLNDPLERTYHYLKFSSTSPTFAAIGLAFEGTAPTSFPVQVLQ